MKEMLVSLSTYVAIVDVLDEANTGRWEAYLTDHPGYRVKITVSDDDFVLLSLTYD